MEDIDWEIFHHDVYINKDLTILRARRLSDLPKEFSFYKNLENIENFVVINQSDCIGYSKNVSPDLKDKSVPIIKMVSKAGNIS